MFKSRNQRLRFRPQNGEMVRLRARVSLYEGRGEFQLIGEFMEPAGAGLLQAQFEALRDKLKLEGLFDSERKKPLPSQVGHLAVISSASGAALQDVLQVLARRNPDIRVTVFATPVQGDDAALRIVDAIEQANTARMQRPDYNFDAIILARGGGSLEDLWAFNDENMARAIAASQLPIVTGVGHEVDFTIADFAADARAPTPSAAAELLSDDAQELRNRLDLQAQRLRRAMALRFERQKSAFDALQDRFRHPGDRLREQYQRLDDLEGRLRRASKRSLGLAKERQNQLAIRLERLAPFAIVRRHEDQFKRLQDDLNASTQRLLELKKQRLSRRSELLSTLNPLAILDRGYAIIQSNSGQVVHKSGDVQVGDRVQARLAQGTLDLSVVQCHEAQ